jgi:hypothetical protein
MTGESPYLEFAGDDGEGLTNGGHFNKFLFGDFDAEFLFECHDKFDNIK